jgi:hypothetical protein
MQMYMTKGGRGAVNPINTQPPKSTPSWEKKKTTP